jgi:hypothetical protein
MTLHGHLVKMGRLTQKTAVSRERKVIITLTPITNPTCPAIPESGDPRRNFTKLLQTIIQR